MAIEFKGEQSAQQDIINDARRGDQGAMIAMAAALRLQSAGGAAQAGDGGEAGVGHRPFHDQAKRANIVSS